MRNLSPLNQFAQINLVILPLNQSKGTIGMVYNNERSQAKFIDWTDEPKTHPCAGGRGQDYDRILEGLRREGHLWFVVRYKDLLPAGCGQRWGQSVIRLRDKLRLLPRVQNQRCAVGCYFQQLRLKIIPKLPVGPHSTYTSTQAILMNDNYTKFIMIMRGVFLSIMVLSTIFFLNRIKYINRSPSIP